MAAPQPAFSEARISRCFAWASAAVARLPRTRDQLAISSLALTLGRIATMGFGFLAWLAAARLFTVQDVGLASGAVSAMMLCVQVALLGIGAAVISHFPAHRRRPAALMDTAFSLVGLGSLLAAGVFLILASVISRELRIVATAPAYASLFVIMTVFGTLGVLYDHVSIALTRGDQVLIRNVLRGLVTLSLIGLLPLAFALRTPGAILTAWAVGNVVTCLLGIGQIWRSIGGYRYRPLIELPLAGALLGTGVRNHLLTLAERAPGVVLPVLVTELLSPTANAHWYTVWMMAWIVFIVPISVGQSLFAEATRRADGLAALVHRSIRTALLLGGVGGVAVALVAPLLLSLLGESYAAAGVTPLRILVLSVLPFTVIQAYYGICRATQRLGEATTVGVATGAISVGGCIMAGLAYGLAGMAVTWVAVQSVASLWSLTRLRSLTRPR